MKMEIYDPTKVYVSHIYEAGHDDFPENKTRSKNALAWITF